MNDIHYHLIINHFPIVANILGILIVAIGFFGRKATVLHTGLGIFIFSALTTLAAFQTGENAEDMAEQLPGVSHELIEEHEHAAERFRNFNLAVGVLSIVTLFLSVKKKPGLVVLTTATLVVALAAAFYASKTGTSGGEIRHPEIREGFTMPAGANPADAEEYDGD